MQTVLERSLYEEDYYAWTKAQAGALRRLAKRRPDLPLDLVNLAEEVESLGRSDLAAARSQVRRIIEHLLKLAHSPAEAPRWGWRGTIIDARQQLADRLTKSLRNEIEAEIEALYVDGRDRAEAGLREHGEHAAADALPTACPYTLAQIEDRSWFPTGHEDG